MPACVLLVIVCSLNFLRNLNAITQMYPENSHNHPIKNGRMMGGGWEDDGRCSYISILAVVS